MKNKLLIKSLVIGVSILFVGASIVSSVESDIEIVSIDSLGTILDVNDGLVGYWSFDEGIGTIAHDDSGNGYDGTIYDAIWSTGVSGNALTFDGDGDYVQFINPVLNIPPYTVCAWGKPVSVSDGDAHYIVSNGAQTGDSYGFHLSMYYDGTWRFGIKRSDGTWGRAMKDATSTDWTFLCGTWDGSTEVDSIKLFVNGNLENAGTPSTAPAGSAQNLRIGAPSNQLYQSQFEGLIDEVRIYNRVLTEDEMLELYNNPAGLKTTIMIGRINNLNTNVGNLMTFEALKLRCIQFSPFEIKKYFTGKMIKISEDYIGLLTPNFAFGLFKANV